MKNVILYFPYTINLKVFVAEEQLKGVKVRLGDVFLKTLLTPEQIEKACSLYGAVIQ